MLFSRRIEIFRLLGFPIRVDLSWFVIFFFILLSLASGVFPNIYPGLTESSYWSMSFVASVGLFLSILFHECSHAFIAKHYGVQIDGITLFIFGGVAEMRQEMPSAKVEFLVALAGPLASIFLSGFFLALAYFWDQASLPGAFYPLFLYLGLVNGVLALFNCVPAFPMDGGRILRAAFWAVSKNFSRSTLVASKVGEVMSWLMIAWGIFRIFMGDALQGLWLLLIAFFIRRASQSSYHQAKLQKQLSQYPVLHFIEESEFVFAPEDMLFKVKQELRNKLVQTHYPIVRDQCLKGVFSVKKIERAFRYQNNTQASTVIDFSEQDLERFTLKKEASAWDAFVLMRQVQSTQVFVLDSESIFLGVVSMSRLLLLIQDYKSVKK